jgi:tetratricopeptide (TPR) repeat protein
VKPPAEILKLNALMLVCVCGLACCSSSGGQDNDAAKQANASVSQQAQPAANPQGFASMTADQWVDLSSQYHKQGKYLEAIGAAQSALYLKPDYPEAYNNIGAAYASLGMWEPAIQAAQQALRLKPDFQLAKNNLAWRNLPR